MGADLQPTHGISMSPSSLQTKLVRIPRCFTNVFLTIGGHIEGWVGGMERVI